MNMRKEGTVSLVSLHFFKEVCATVLSVESLLGPLYTQ